MSKLKRISWFFLLRCCPLATFVRSSLSFSEIAARRSYCHPLSYFNKVMSTCWLRLQIWKTTKSFPSLWTFVCQALLIISCYEYISIINMDCVHLLLARCVDGNGGLCFQCSKYILRPNILYNILGPNILWDRDVTLAQLARCVDGNGELGFQWSPLDTRMLLLHSPPCSVHCSRMLQCKGSLVEEAELALGGMSWYRLRWNPAGRRKQQQFRRLCSGRCSGTDLGSSHGVCDQPHGGDHCHSVQGQGEELEQGQEGEALWQEI